MSHCTRVISSSPEGEQKAHKCTCFAKSALCTGSYDLHALNSNNDNDDDDNDDNDDDGDDDNDDDDGDNDDDGDDDDDGDGDDDDKPFAENNETEGVSNEAKDSNH